MRSGARGGGAMRCGAQRGLAERCAAKRSGAASFLLCFWLGPAIILRNEFLDLVFDRGLDIAIGLGDSFNEAFFETVNVI